MPLSKRLAILVMVLACWSTLLAESPRNHVEINRKWLRQYIGEWETEVDVMMGPGEPHVKSSGSEKTRLLGDYWIVMESKSDIKGSASESLLTLGYDDARKKFVSSWVDTGTSMLWTFEGKLDPSGRILTMESEGGGIHILGKKPRFKEVTEFKTADHRVYTLSMRQDKGDWLVLTTLHAHRKVKPASSSSSTR